MSAWPTLAVVDPAGYVVGSHAGEFSAEALVPFVDGVIARAVAQGQLSAEPLHFPADSPTITPGNLRYPGKVIVEGHRIAVVDLNTRAVDELTLD